MSAHYKSFVLTAILFSLLPAAAAEYTPGPTNVSRSDQVKLAMNSTRELLALGLNADVVPAPVAPAIKLPSKNVPERVGFSEEGAAIRWLYSTVAQKRTFVTYTGPQRGRPAELRITLRLSLL